MKFKFGDTTYYRPSAITPEERRLIDEAIAAGKVKKIPQGQSALLSAVFNPATGALNYDLSKPRLSGPLAAAQKRSQDFLHRLNRFAELYNAGKTPEELAAIFETSLDMIRYYRTRAAKTGLIIYTPTKTAPIPEEAIRARVIELKAQQLTLRQIADRIGISFSRLQPIHADLIASGKIKQVFHKKSS